MRAWIEIFDGDKEKKNIEVALFMRAWIEIRADTFCLFSFVSPSSWGRGLKLDTIESKRTVEEVALFMRAWIEMRYSIARRA